MNNLFNRFNAKKEVSSAAKADLFFTENNVNGYMSKESFTNYLSGLQENDFMKFERFLDFTSKMFPINNIPISRVDKYDNEEVIWLKFKLPNAEHRIRILYDENILRFIKDYQEGKFRNRFTLEELILEAGAELTE